MTSFEQLLIRLARILDGANIPYMVIGGQAVLIHGEPRSTMDIDITLGVGTDAAERILKLLKENGFKPLVPNPKRFITETHVLPAQNSHALQRVDFIFSEIPYERQAIQRGVNRSIGGVNVHFISPEDLLVHKLVAGRPRDIEDARSIWLRNRTGLDKTYIQKRLKQFAALEGLEDVEARWKQIQA